MQWVGAGCPAFLGNAAGGPEGRPVRIDSLRAFGEVFGNENGSSPLQRSVRSYFSFGGRRCYVVHLPGVDVAPEGRAAALLQGDDGGPGYRSGLNALSELENVTINLELASGKTGVLRNAFQIPQLSLGIDEGEISVRFEGPSGEWTTVAATP